MSPELIEGKQYSTKSDIWAAGCVLYEMLSLKKVFDATNQLRLALKISIGEIEEIQNEIYSNEIKNLCKQLLSKDPADRPSAEEILSSQQFNLYPASRTDAYKLKIEELSCKTVASRGFRSNSNLISDNNNKNAPIFSNTSPIITSKLSEIYVWGGGKPIKKFDIQKDPLQVSIGPGHYAAINVEKELFTWGVSTIFMLIFIKCLCIY
jgi:NIMA (never in mitosis gene a)-related kinase 9